MYTTELVESSIARLRGGDAKASQELLRHARHRIRHLALPMMSGFPVIQQWADTDDIVHDAAINLLRSLESQPPQSPREFFRLATTVIRGQLIDLTNHFQHLTDSDDGRAAVAAAAEDPHLARTSLPATAPVTDRLQQWRALHEAAGSLSEELREVFDLVYYNGLTMAEVQQVLRTDGETVRRSWLLARLRIQEQLDDGDTRR